MKGRALLLSLMVIWACGDPVSPPAPVVASVIIDPILAIVAPGESVTVASRALTADLRTVHDAIEWSTSDPAVATVASNGTVTARGNGTATIPVAVPHAGGAQTESNREKKER